MAYLVYSGLHMQMGFSSACVCVSFIKFQFVLCLCAVFMTDTDRQWTSTLRMQRSGVTMRTCPMKPRPRCSRCNQCLFSRTYILYRLICDDTVWRIFCMAHSLLKVVWIVTITNRFWVSSCWSNGCWVWRQTMRSPLTLSWGYWQLSWPTMVTYRVKITSGWTVSFVWESLHCLYVYSTHL